MMSNLRFLSDGRSTWSVLWVLIKRRNSTFKGELPRTVLQLEPKVIQSLEKMEYKPKKHPGRSAPKLTLLPERFAGAANVLLQNYPTDTLLTQATAMSRYLLCRKPPMEDDEIMEKAAAIERKLLLKDPKLNVVPTSEEDIETLQKKVKEKVARQLRQVIYHWEAVEYNKHRGMMYLVTRAAPEYAALNAIFKELKWRAPDFRPAAILDFGSGVGTVFWACHNYWGEAMEEYFAVDISSDMNNIAQLLVQDGRESNRPILKGTFFRQFLPASHTLNYDLVVSSYSLMELSSRNLRLQTLENLWSKTNQFLVLVEIGSNAGYKLIMEARDFILNNAVDDVHVFSPCSHDVMCPKLATGIPCNFEAGYYPLLGKHADKILERYSYVVLRKRRRPAGEQWPRVIAPVLPRGGHAICRMCCSDGQLKEAVVTSAKHGKHMYKCARASQWGDLLPATYSDGDKSPES